MLILCKINRPIQKTERYYTGTRRYSMVFWISAILTGILSREAKPRGTKYRWISPDIERGKHPEWNIAHIPRGRLLAEREKQPRGMCAIFHEGCFPSSISVGTGVILRGFLYWPAHFTCICRIDQELFTLKKPKLNLRKITAYYFDTIPKLLK